MLTFSLVTRPPDQAELSRRAAERYAVLSAVKERSRQPRAQGRAPLLRGLVRRLVTHAAAS